MKFELLRKYARLAVCTGINIQKGQKLVLSAPVECAPFARLCVEEAYRAGAADVIINWHDDFCSRQHWLYAEDSLFDSVYPWAVQKNDMLSAEGAGFLSISAGNPENLKGVDPERLRRANAASGKAFEVFDKRLMANAAPWCVISTPVESWAKKVFPDAEGDAVDRLWEAIFSAVRISEDSDPVEEWNRHCDMLETRSRILNEYNFKYLIYRNSLGTDLRVELPENHVWAGGGDMCKSGVRFIANMPTEEIFTAPKKDGINGVLYASKPLALNGNIIDGIRFGFTDGKITDIHADSGEDVLRAAVETDEGSHFIGEIALVPYDSPISNSNILFYNTLFDENASCHFAFGQAYPGCVCGGNDMTTEELIAAGINADSSMHEDFMVGTRDLSVCGVTHDGKKIAVFENGNFAF